MASITYSACTDCIQQHKYFLQNRQEDSLSKVTTVSRLVASTSFLWKHRFKCKLASCMGIHTVFIR